MKTFVIGDVHGHLDRLEALLTKAGIDPERHHVVQLGDLGTYKATTQAEDLAVWEWASKHNWFTTLWGNHEAALMTHNHRFSGYVEPLPDVRRLMAAVEREGRLRFASEANGFLLTHAGLHDSWASDLAGRSVLGLALAIEARCTEFGWGSYVAIRDDIGRWRGGNCARSGILWRDFREPIANIPQVFGHTRGSDIRRAENTLEAICIDVAERGDDGNLAGIWLPTMQVVAVGPDAPFLERALDEV